MKTLVVILLLASLVANSLWWMRPADGSQHESATTPAANSTAAVGPEPAVVQPNHLADTLVPAVVPLQWADAPVGDLQALTHYLRERGVPLHIIRGIITHYLAEDYREKRTALTARMSPMRYWENSSNSHPEDLALRAELRNLAREQNERMNTLVGPVEPAFDTQYLSYIRQRYGNLPTAKVMELQAIERDYNELQSQVRQASQGLLLAEDREALALIDQERRKDIMASLTPEEYEEYEFRTSNTGSQLRRNLDMMQPTEEEFRTIFRLQRPFDEKYLSSSAPRTPTSAAERQTAERELIAAVIEALGPERAAEYEKSRDYSYVHAHSVAKGLGLPKESGDRLWSVQKNTLQQVNEVGRSGSATPAERSQRMLEVVNAAKAAIAAEIGEENMQTYQQGGGGWLRSMEQSATRISRPPARPAAP